MQVNEIETDMRTLVFYVRYLFGKYVAKYDIDKHTYIDGANPSFIKSLKLQIGEDAD